MPARQLPSHMEDDRPDRAPKRPAGLRHTRTQARRACHTAASTPPSADTYTLTCTHGESLETVRWRTNKHTQNTKQWTTMPRQSDDMAHAAGRTKVRMPTSRCRRSCQEHRAWARTRAAVARTVDNHTRGHTRNSTRQRCMRPVPSPMTHHPHPTHPPTATCYLCWALANSPRTQPKCYPRVTHTLSRAQHLSTAHVPGNATGVW